MGRQGLVAAWQVAEIEDDGSHLPDVLRDEAFEQGFVTLLVKHDGPPQPVRIQSLSRLRKRGGLDVETYYPAPRTRDSGQIKGIVAVADGRVDHEIAGSNPLPQVSMGKFG